jgi:flagellar biosynthesis/type III secretory pathway M-ring protein FliF/YscJ
MSATALLLLLGLVLVFAGVFAALLSGDTRASARSATRGAEPAPRRPTPPARTPAPAPSRSRPLSRREREQMLAGIQNLARDNPARTAALVRSWLNA